MFFLYLVLITKFYQNKKTLIPIIFFLLSTSSFGQLLTGTTLTVNGPSTLNGSLSVTGNSTFNSEIYSKGIRADGEFRLYNGGIHGVKFAYFPSASFVYLDFNNKMFFRSLTNGNISPLLLQSDGSVVINAQTNYGSSALYNTQGFKLAVNGGILCEEIKVILDVPQWDVVFAPDYSLMSLYQVENYIKINKHLPNIPSAKEFKENGYSLGEMDGMLLRKTEELTLYMIEMRKELDELKKQNEELRKKLETKN